MSAIRSLRITARFPAHSRRLPVVGRAVRSRRRADRPPAVRRTGSMLPTSAGETIGKGPVRVASAAAALWRSGAGAGRRLDGQCQPARHRLHRGEPLDPRQHLDRPQGHRRDAPAAPRRPRARPVAEGASLILGPLRADQVGAVGSVARAAGITVIGFSNNSGAAQPGVYLLNVLPEVEVRRSLRFAPGARPARFRRRSYPPPTTARSRRGAFRQAVADLGLTTRAIYSFSSEAEARTAIQQLVPLLQQGQVDALFMPDRATAPSFGVLLEQAGIRRAPSRSSARPTGTPTPRSPARRTSRAPSIPRSTTPATSRSGPNTSRSSAARRTRSRPSPTPRQSSPTPLPRPALRPPS